MFRKCCVPQCNSIRQDVKLHRFPVTGETRKQWLQCINSDKIRLSLTDDEVHKSYVCHKHFEKKFVNVHSNHLKVGAYPSLFTASEISSGNPSTISFDTDDTKTAMVDHTYTRKRPHHIEHAYALPIGHRPKKDARIEIPETSPVPSTSSQQSTLNAPMQIASDTGTMPSMTNQTDTVAFSTSTPTPLQPLSSGSICKTPRKALKRKLVSCVKSMTPRCRLLYTEYKKARRQKDYKSRAKRALDFSKKKSLEEATKNMSPLSRRVLWMQIKLATKNKKARRFTTEEKLIALAIYKQGPKSYKFLQKIFILPSKTTLKKLIGQLNIGTGINPQIFDLLKKKVASWDDKRKLCTVMFDEMTLELATTYSTNRDAINGFVELNEKTDHFADHALVFMLRGAVCKWQQPIAFYFCEGATPTQELKTLLKEIVAAVTDTGLKPIALVSDQGTSFQSAMRELLEETKGDQLRAGETVYNTVHLSGNTLSVFYDAPHLIKGIRNNLVSKDLSFEGNRASWQDILDVYNADCNHGKARILHKLTDQHVIPGKIKKMKVKNCVRVLSKSVSAALSYTSKFPLYPDGKPVSKTIETTADAISFLDDLFDSVNGAGTLDKNSKGKVLRKAVTEKTEHHAFWTTAVKKVENMKFITKDGKMKTVPSIKNWIVTLKSFQRMWVLLKSKNIKIMRPRYFNSDPIENFFGQVRAYNYRSNDPSANAFVSTFKSLLLTRFINFHSETYNCEDDVSKDLLTIQALFKNTDNSTPKPTVSSSQTDADAIDEEETVVSFNHDTIQAQVRREKIDIHSKAYTAGWVTRKILMKVKCKECERNLVTDEESSTHAYIHHKEFKALKQRKLCYPSGDVVRSFGHVVETTNKYLEVNGHKNQLSEKITEKIKAQYSFDFLSCESHKELVLESFLNISIKLFIFNWCTIINKILKGTDIIRLERRTLPPMQQKALNKYKKKLKNKKLN